MNFLHNFNPQPILFKLGPLTFRWYGLMIAIGLLSAIFVSAYLAKRRGRNPDDVYSLALWLAIGGIIGARLYDFVIIEFDYFIGQPLDIFKIWQGGLAIHGAVIGGVLVMIAWCRAKKQKIFDWLDLAAVGMPLGQAIGRFGNYFNQELFGGPTNLPWGIPIDMAHRPIQYLSSTHFHPAFLYESILNFILFLILFFLMRKDKLPAGAVALLYIAGYGLIRFMIEFIRIDETAMVLGWRLPQVVSVIATATAILIFSLLFKKKKT